MKSTGAKTAEQVRDFVLRLKKRKDVRIHDYYGGSGGRAPKRHPFVQAFPSDFLDFVRAIDLELSWSFTDLRERLMDQDECLSGGRILTGNGPPTDERVWEDRPDTLVHTGMGRRAREERLSVKTAPIMSNTDNDYLAFAHPSGEQVAPTNLMMVYGRVDFSQIDCTFVELISTGIVFGFGWDFPLETMTEHIHAGMGIGFEEPLQAALRLARGHMYDMRRLTLPPIVRAKVHAMRKDDHRIEPTLLKAGYTPPRARKIALGLINQVRRAEP